MRAGAVIVTIVVALYLTTTLDAGDKAKKNEIKVLTSANFSQAVKKHNLLLVLFFSDNAASDILMMEFEDAISALRKKNSSVEFGMVDCEKEKKLTQDYQVDECPALIFFRSGKSLDYTEGHVFDQIVKWVRQMEHPAKILDSVQEAKAFIASTSVVIIGFFKKLNTDGANQFLLTACIVEDHVFGITHKKAVFKEYGLSKDGVILFKKFDERKNVYKGKITKDGLIDFIVKNSLPVVVDFNSKTSEKILNGLIKSCVLIFLSKRAGHYDKHMRDITDAARYFLKKIQFVTINTDEPQHRTFIDYYGIKENEIPTLRIVNFVKNTHYKPPTNDLSKNSIISFVQKYPKGMLKPHLLGQDLPKDWYKKNVKVLVISNFDKVAFNKKLDVLVLFYAPWCEDSQKTLRVFDTLGEKYKHNKTLIVAKMDATANELGHTNIRTYPSVKLYRKNNNQDEEVWR